MTSGECRAASSDEAKGGEMAPDAPSEEKMADDSCEILIPQLKFKCFCLLWFDETNFIVGFTFPSAADAVVCGAEGVRGSTEEENATTLVSASTQPDVADTKPSDEVGSKSHSTTLKLSLVPAALTKTQGSVFNNRQRWFQRKRLRWT